MGILKITLLFFCAFLYACTSIRLPAEDFLSKVQMRFREPGEKLLAFPEEIWREYDCDKKDRPFFEIETNELIPRRIHAGEKFNHRLVYALCSNERMNEIVGTLYQRIYFKGQMAGNDTENGFSVKPGRWRKDLFVKVPTDADRGIYSSEIEFKSRELNFKEMKSFIVQ
jgi:hypothetical protein